MLDFNPGGVAHGARDEVPAAAAVAVVLARTRATRLSHRSVARRRDLGAEPVQAHVGARAP